MTNKPKLTKEVKVKEETPTVKVKDEKSLLKGKQEYAKSTGRVAVEDPITGVIIVK